MDMEKELSRIQRKDSLSFRVKCGIVGASVVSNLANVFAGGYKGALDAQGIDSNVMNIYPCLILSNVVTGAGTGLVFEHTSSPVFSAIVDGIASPIEFAIGYGFGYIGGKVFS